MSANPFPFRAGGARQQAAEQGKELLVDQVLVLLDDLRPDLRPGGLGEALDQHQAVLLFFDHFGRNAVFCEDGLDHGLVGQVGLRFEEIGFAFLWWQAVHDLFDERPERLFLLVEWHIQFRREVRQQQLLVSIMVDDGSGQPPLKTAMRAVRNVRNPA